MSEGAAADAPRGLEGEIAAATAVGSVEDGHLQYRGYSIDELAPHASYEEVAHLLLNGDLPTASELAAFKAELVEHRALSPFLLGILEKMSVRGGAMDVLRTIVSAAALR